MTGSSCVSGDWGHLRSWRDKDMIYDIARLGMVMRIIADNRFLCIASHDKNRVLDHGTWPDSRL